MSCPQRVVCSSKRDFLPARCPYTILQKLRALRALLPLHRKGHAPVQERWLGQLPIVPKHAAAKLAIRKNPSLDFQRLGYPRGASNSSTSPLHARTSPPS